MSYSTSPFNPDQKYKGQVKSELKQADDNFNILAQAFKNNDPTTGIVNHASVADSCSNCNGSSGGNSSDDNLGIIPDGFDDWLVGNLIDTSQSKLEFFIQDTAPSYDSNSTITWYNTTNNTLNLVTQQGNVSIDWRYWAKKDLWYGLGKLKIENNQLKISNDGSNWLTIYPNTTNNSGLVADDTNANDDYKINYLFANSFYNQSLDRPTNSISSSYSKTRVACVSASSWRLYLVQNDNQNTAGWLGLHLGDIDISDGQGQMTSNNSNYDASGYSDINNAKFLPICWMPVRDNQQYGNYICDATITITPDNKITVSTHVYKTNASDYDAYFTCSGTFPSSANHLGTFVLNGNTYTTTNYTITRNLYRLATGGVYA